MIEFKAVFTNVLLKKCCGKFWAGNLFRINFTFKDSKYDCKCLIEIKNDMKLTPKFITQNMFGNVSCFYEDKLICKKIKLNKYTLFLKTIIKLV